MLGLISGRILIQRPQEIREKAAGNTYYVATTPENTPTITPPAGGQGDINGDRLVSSADFVVWLVNFGSSNVQGPSQGDFNSDSKVDGADFVIWLVNFGN